MPSLQLHSLFIDALTCADVSSSQDESGWMLNVLSISLDRRCRMNDRTRSPPLCQLFASHSHSRPTGWETQSWWMSCWSLGMSLGTRFVCCLWSNSTKVSLLTEISRNFRSTKSQQAISVVNAALTVDIALISANYQPVLTGYMLRRLCYRFPATSTVRYQRQPPIARRAFAMSKQIISSPDAPKAIGPYRYYLLIA